MTSPTPKTKGRQELYVPRTRPVSSESFRGSGIEGVEQASSRHQINPRHWTVQEAAQDVLIARCIPRILLARELLCIIGLLCFACNYSIPRDTCKGPLVIL